MSTPWWHKGSAFDRWTLRFPQNVIIMALLVGGPYVVSWAARPVRTPRPRPAAVAPSATPAAPAQVSMFDELVAEAAAEVRRRDMFLHNSAGVRVTLIDHGAPELRGLVVQELELVGDRRVLEARVRAALAPHCAKADPATVEKVLRIAFGDETPDPMAPSRAIGGTSSWEDVEPGTCFVIETATATERTIEATLLVARDEKTATLRIQKQESTAREVATPLEHDDLAGWWQIQRKGFEKVETPAGTFECVRFEGFTRLEDGRFAQLEKWVARDLPVAVRSVSVVDGAKTESRLVRVTRAN